MLRRRAERCGGSAAWWCADAAARVALLMCGYVTSLQLLFLMSIEGLMQNVVWVTYSTTEKETRVWTLACFVCLLPVSTRPLTRRCLCGQELYGWTKSTIDIMSSWGAWGYIVFCLFTPRIVSRLGTSPVPVLTCRTCVTHPPPPTHRQATLRDVSRSLILVPLLRMTYTLAGVRASITLGAGLIFGAAALRLAVSRHGGVFSQALGHASCIVNAMAGPLSFATPTKLSAQWFAPHHRTLSTALPQFASYVGTGVAFLLALRVRVAADVRTLVVAEAAASGLLLLLCLADHVWFAPLPPLPPSASADVDRVPVHLVRNARVLLSNPNFVMLMVSYGIPCGFYRQASSPRGPLFRYCHRVTSRGWSLSLYLSISLTLSPSLSPSSLLLPALPSPHLH